ncbi:hypothetical protein DTW90_35475 [Neorhizobium sp. P12A]|nr:hypothetical protein DTW90_35475 [Neorhizobium sp. P12A]
MPQYPRNQDYEAHQQQPQAVENQFASDWLGSSQELVPALTMGTFSFGGEGDFSMVARQGVSVGLACVDGLRG